MRIWKAMLIEHRIQTCNYIL